MAGVSLAHDSVLNTLNYCFDTISLQAVEIITSTSLSDNRFLQSMYELRFILNAYILSKT